MHAKTMSTYIYIYISASFLAINTLTQHIAFIIAKTNEIKLTTGTFDCQLREATNQADSDTYVTRERHVFADVAFHGAIIIDAIQIHLRMDIRKHTCNSPRRQDMYVGMANALQ